MNGIVFVSGKISDRQHTLTAFLNMDADLVFDDVECDTEGGGEVNDYLLVHAKHKRHLLNLWGGLSLGSAIRAARRRMIVCFAYWIAWRAAGIGSRWMKLKDG